MLCISPDARAQAKRLGFVRNMAKARETQEPKLRGTAPIKKWSRVKLLETTSTTILGTHESDVEGDRGNHEKLQLESSPLERKFRSLELRFW